MSATDNINSLRHQGKVFVTGGAGLVGRALITQLLQQGRSVIAVYNKTPIPHINQQLLQQVQCDILDITGLEEAMAGAVEVYHCAALVNFNPAKKRELFKVNVEGTANVVNAAITTGIKKLVHVSSVAALGRIRENELIDETMVWTEESNNSNYGQSKYLAELEVWRGAGEGLDAVVVNPSIILGDGDWSKGSSQIFKSVYDGFPWYTKGVTGFVDVRDVARAMLMLMDSNISGERFILSAENLSYQQLFTMVAKGFNIKPPSKEVTPLLSKIIWRVEALKSFITGKEPLITRETVVTAMVSVYYNNSKLLKFLPGFVYTPMEDTIAHTCKVLQQQLNK